MKLNDIFETTEDRHAEVYAAYERKMDEKALTAKQIAEFKKLSDQFGDALHGEDPHGNSPEDYLDDMKEIVGVA